MQAATKSKASRKSSRPTVYEIHTFARIRTFDEDAKNVNLRRRQSHQQFMYVGINVSVGG